MQDIHSDILKQADAKRATLLQRYFKTGKGEYAEGDIFVGLTVPQVRLLSKKYKNISLRHTEKLLKSKIHEERLLALQILSIQFKKSDEKNRRSIYNFYLSHTHYINNWDLVDLSARDIVGAYLFDKDRSILQQLARSSNMWERRIAIISTMYFINNGQAEDSLIIAKLLLSDTQDLIHKAVGWTLREIGKRCAIEQEEDFLKRHYKNIPRTTLRYAIERFSEQKRKQYLRGIFT